MINNHYKCCGNEIIEDENVRRVYLGNKFNL